MNSNQIIFLIENCIKEHFSYPITYNFNKWNHFYKNNKDRIYSKLGENFIGFDLKNDASKIIMNNLFRVSLHNGMQKWNRDYVRNKYEETIDGIDVVYYPSINPKRIIFNFSSMGKNKYDRYSRFWDPYEKWNSENAYVFFKDDSYSYYLGKSGESKSGTYARIIKDFYLMNKLNPVNCHTVGTSMGGYAAIYYATILQMNSAIVASPQITYEATRAHEYRNWEKHIREIGDNWVDLNLLIQRFKHVPNIYIEYGNFSADKLAAEKFIEFLNLKSECLFIKRKTNWEEHTIDTILSKETILNSIAFFESNGFIYTNSSKYN